MGDAERERREGAGLPEPQLAVDFVVGEEPAAGAVRVAGCDERQVGDEREQHRRGEEPGGGGRAHDPQEGEAGERGRPDQSRDEARAVEPLDEAGGARDAHEVARALRASLCRGIERERREQPQHDERARVSDHQPRAFQATAGAAAGVGERRMGDERGHAA